jgi:hypothetical protein
MWLETVTLRSGVFDSTQPQLCRYRYFQITLRLNRRGRASARVCRKPILAPRVALVKDFIDGYAPRSQKRNPMERVSLRGLQEADRAAIWNRLADAPENDRAPTAFRIRRTENVWEQIKPGGSFLYR